MELQDQPDILVEAEATLETKIQELEQLPNMNTNNPCTITDLETFAAQSLKALPKVNRAKLRLEMANMNVYVSKDPTTFDINEGLAKVQGYKDRLVEILNLAEAEFSLRESMYELLEDANNVISKASSADKRKGEAQMKYNMQYIHLKAAETFVEEVERYLNNMKSIGETISRQGSVISTQVTLGEYRKRQPGQSMTPDSEAEEMDYKSGSKRLDWNEV